MAKLSAGGAGFRNLPAVRAELRHAMDLIRGSCPAAVYAFGVEIMKEAKKRTPVDTGALRDSGFVSLPRDTLKGANITLGFGGPAAQYAIIQHENTTYSHRVGEAKYLENAIAVVAPRQGVLQMVATINNAIRNRKRAKVRRHPQIPTTVWG